MQTVIELLSSTFVRSSFCKLQTRTTHCLCALIVRIFYFCDCTFCHPFNSFVSRVRGFTNRYFNIFFYARYLSLAAQTESRRCTVIPTYTNRKLSPVFCFLFCFPSLRNPQFENTGRTTTVLPPFQYETSG